MTDLTTKEQDHVRAALRFLRARTGGWTPLARALHTSEPGVRSMLNGNRPVSARMVLRVARLASVSIDRLLAGDYPPPGTCPHCGHRADEGAQANGAAVEAAQ